MTLQGQPKELPQGGFTQPWLQGGSPAWSLRIEPQAGESLVFL